jgi:signal peptidase I
MSEFEERDLGLAESSSSAPKDQKSAAKSLRDWIIVVVVALFAALMIRVFVFQQFYISGPSMQTTLYDNNRVLVNKLSYKLHGIGRGDVVVFDRVTTNGGTVNHDDLIKRVIALGGDTLEIKKCVVYLNGVALEEKYLDAGDVAQSDLNSLCRVANLKEQTIPDGKIFVMGDNRSESFDSRMFGPIDEDLVVGRAFMIVWPINRIGLL